MWAATTSPRDNWERLVAAVIKRDQIRQLFHQDSITTVDSDSSLRSASSPSSPQRPLAKNSLVEDAVRKGGSGTITQKLFSALLRRKKPKASGLAAIPEYHLGLLESYHLGFESYSLIELQVATDNFSNKNVIGSGGFGRVYKGRLADGSLVAVKKLTARVSEVRIREELEMASIVKHRNVIGLNGFCITENEQLYVYPYMANGSVARCLRERSESEPPLKWVTRSLIAMKVARGLAYLHYGCIRGIIHGDVKAANILLDEHFEAVVCDFGLAKFIDCNHDDDDDGISGAICHICLEYPSTFKISLKTDVYGYGVFLLELISGQRAFDLARLANDHDVMLQDWVKKIYEERQLEALIDRDLRSDFIEEELVKLLQIALMCTQHDPDGHPTMSEVVMILQEEHSLTEAWEEFLQKSSEEISDAEWIISDEDGISADELSGPR